MTIRSGNSPDGLGVGTHHSRRIVDNYVVNNYKNNHLDFHFRIAQGSRNRWLIHHLSSELYQLIRMCRRRSGRMPERPATALKEHRHIVEVIAMRDGELAEILMRRHIRGAWETLKDLLPREENE